MLQSPHSHSERVRYLASTVKAAAESNHWLEYLVKDLLVYDKFDGFAYLWNYMKVRQE